MVRVVLLILVLVPAFASAQIWDFMGVQKLSGSINTDSEEAAPFLTPDGKTLYFSRILHSENAGGKFSGSDIWVSSIDNKKAWSKASSFPYNDRGNNSVIGVHADGTMLYLLNTTGSEKTNGFYVSKKSGDSWSKGELIPIEGLNPQGFLGFYVSPDFEVISISMKADDSRGQEDLYVTSRNSSGQWTKPKNLGSSVNTQGFEISPFLSSDKKRLYFSSDGHRGFGDGDIFYCDRLYNSWDTWTAPKNLGEKLNSKGFDAYFSIYGDSVAYFCSNRGNRYSDIFRVKVVPGSEVLAFGQEYLTTDEIAKVLGAEISRKITFEKNAVDLTAQQREIIFYIGNKLSLYRDINFHISIVEESNPTLTQKRMDAVAKHLRESGIENLRMLISNSGIRTHHETRTTFELLLFK